MCIAYIFNDVEEVFLDDVETDTNESQKLVEALSEASRITRVSTIVGSLIFGSFCGQKVF
jgi:uncharacterized protein YqkB